MEMEETVKGINKIQVQMKFTRNFNSFSLGLEYECDKELSESELAEHTFNLKKLIRNNCMRELKKDEYKQHL